MQRQLRSGLFYSGYAALALIICYVPAFAQAPSTDSGVAADKSGLRPLEEIVVTAEKRTESLQDVPAAITALNEQDLRIAGIDDVTRLGLVTPGMVVGYSGAETRIAMRGARTNNVGAEAAQVVGIFNDGAYIASTTQIMAAYLDVQRVEVLRGPQGTLYGRNTFAGAINIISNPVDLAGFGGWAEATLGNYGAVRVKGVVNIPISETFGIRIAGLGDWHDGYIKNSYLSGDKDDLRDEDVGVGRITLAWQPSDEFSTTLRYTQSDRNISTDSIWGYTQIGCYQNYGDPTTSTGLSANSSYVPQHCWQPGPNADPTTWNPGDEATEQDDGAYHVSRNTPAIAEQSAESVNLQASYDMDFASLVFIGSYDHFKSLQTSDFDYSNGSFYGETPTNNNFSGYDTDQDTYSAELRLVSAGDSRFQWLLGAYYFESQADWDYGFLYNGEYARYSDFYDYATGDAFVSKSTAVFGNSSFAITDRFRLLGGLRWTHDENSLSDIQTSVADGGSWKNTSWKAGAEYDLAETSMMYFIVSTGYRIGGANGQAVVDQGAPQFYEPEDVTAYELGNKSQFLDGELVLNTSLYYNDYSNMQAQSFVQTCIIPDDPTSCTVSEFTENGGKVTAKGIEFELDWLPGESFFMSGTLSLMNAKFGTYNVSRLAGLGNYEGRQDVTQTAEEIIAAGGSPTLSLKGWRPALSPKYSGSIQTGYVWDIDGNNSLMPMVQFFYSDKYWSYDINVPGSEQDSFVQTDLRLVLNNSKYGFEMEAYVQNLGNKAVLTRSVIFAPNEALYPTASIQANYADPRIWGIRARVSF
jgi:outer membrane receptor protein involved in Fe transport